MKHSVIDELSVFLSTRLKIITMSLWPHPSKSKKEFIDPRARGSSSRGVSEDLQGVQKSFKESICVLQVLQ